MPKSGVRGAGIDVNQHGLSASSHLGVAAGHVHGNVLVRAQDNLRRLQSIGVEPRKLLDQRGMIGTEIAEQVFDADLVQRLKKIKGGRVDGCIRNRGGEAAGIKGTHASKD